jgi:hypothetical protein
MRHHSIVLCALVAACGYAPLAGAGTSSPLTFTLDLQAPCGASGCSGNHPTDISLSATASSFTYTNGSTSGSYVANMSMQAAVVCDEIGPSPGSIQGAVGALRIGPTFTNASPGGLLEFNNGGPSVVDLAAMTFDGESPAGFAATYSNSSTTPQVACYQINPISGGPVALAPGPTGIFNNGFDIFSSHFANEPWLSLQTVFSPQSAGGKNQSQKGNAQVNGVTPTNVMGYVIQVHNAAAAVANGGWRLDLGYDFAFFDPTNNGQTPGLVCVLGAGIPQPGLVSGNANCSNIGAVAHTFTAADIVGGSNSIYMYVQHTSSSVGGSSWGTLAAGEYPAVASIFPPLGTFPQRFDDKSAVASANNLPSQNVGSIVCNNDTVSTACVIADQDGNPVPAAVTFNNSISGGGTANIDPVAYFVDPTSGSTLPGNAVADTLTVSNVSCSDPSGILASPLAGGSFSKSTGTPQGGAMALGFSFAPSGSLYVPGTATCTATFGNIGYSPALSSKQNFTITMLTPTTSHFSVTTPAGATAGVAFNTLTVTALNSANQTVGSYNGIVHFTSSDPSATLPADTVLSGGTGTFSGTFVTAGNRTITATDTVNSGLKGTSAPTAVGAAATSYFVVNAPGTAVADSQFSFTVSAFDQFNNSTPNYSGLVQFSSSDGLALLPVPTGLVFGTGIFASTLNSTGNQTITATDTVTSSMTGSSGPINITSN